jgi:hypothetical protein
MPDEQGNETREEALERIRIVRATQIFGDTPTDPTIGDVTVPAHDEEGANVAAAEVASRVEDGDDEAADLSPEEAKRQLEPLDADEVDENAEDHENNEGGEVAAGEVDLGRTDSDGGDSSDEPSGDDTDGDGDSDDEDRLNAKKTIAQIEAATSVEEVNALAGGDERVTVQRAADKKRSELA